MEQTFYELVSGKKVKELWLVLKMFDLKQAFVSKIKKNF